MRRASCPAPGTTASSPAAPTTPPTACASSRTSPAATLSREGDQVITTGLGGVFPPDVLVGVIKELTPEASGKSTLAVIQPGADPRTVRHVFIITNY